jgi:hypothetical protein
MIKWINLEREGGYLVLVAWEGVGGGHIFSPALDISIISYFFNFVNKKIKKNF